MNPTTQAASGGIGGFLAFFLLACALWLLMRNMNARLRNVKYREELELERQANESEQEVVSRPPRPDGRVGSKDTDQPERGAAQPDDEGARRAEDGGQEALRRDASNPDSSPLPRA